MPLVDYDSDEDEEQLPTVSTKELKRKLSRSQSPCLPSLPDSFHDLYATAARSGVQDDPSLHQGRQRAIHHIEGNWPSHVYIEWRPGVETKDILDSLILRLNTMSASAQITSLLTTDLGAAAPLHISLSRSLSLQGEQRQPFLDRLAAVVHGRKVKTFEARPDAIKWVSNYEGNRWFLILQMKRPPEDIFQMLLRACNEVAKGFGQPLLYQNHDTIAPQPLKRAKVDTKEQALSCPSAFDEENPFHISIAWALSEPGDHLKEQTLHLWSAELEKVIVPVDRVKIKVGNAIHNLPLLARQPRVKTIMGLE